MSYINLEYIIDNKKTFFSFFEKYLQFKNNYESTTNVKKTSLMFLCYFFALGLIPVGTYKLLLFFKEIEVHMIIIIITYLASVFFPLLASKKISSLIDKNKIKKKGKQYREIEKSLSGAYHYNKDLLINNFIESLSKEEQSLFNYICKNNKIVPLTRIVEFSFLNDDINKYNIKDIKRLSKYLTTESYQFEILKKLQKKEEMEENEKITINKNSVVKNI